MRKNLMWGVAGLVVLGACGGEAAKEDEKEDAKPAFASRNSFVIDRARCSPQGNETVLDIEKWILEITPAASVPWTLSSNSNTSVTIEPRNSSQWPFEEAGSFVIAPGQTVLRKVKANPTPPKHYRYKIKISCGTGPNQHTVVIDPDIFVD